MEPKQNKKTLPTVLETVGIIVVIVAIAAGCCNLAHNYLGLPFSLGTEWVIPTLLIGGLFYAIGKVMSLPWKKLDNVTRIFCVIGLLMMAISIVLQIFSNHSILVIVAFFICGGSVLKSASQHYVKEN